MFGVPQGLNFETTFTQHFFSRFVFIQSDIDIANFADDNTPYLSAKNQEDVVESLERATVSLFRYFESNLLRRNADKCHFLIGTSKKQA